MGFLILSGARNAHLKEKANSNSKMTPLEKALKYGGRILEILSPHCERIELAGSVRRGKSEVNDIELVCIPKRSQDLLGTSADVCEGFINAVNRFEKVRGEPTGKLTRRVLPNTGGVEMDIFIANADNWGWIMALHTGSADFAQVVLLGALKRSGLGAVDGYIYNYREDCLNPKLVKVPDEAEFFEMIGLPFIDPRSRMGDYASLKKMLLQPAENDFAEPLQNPCTPNDGGA